MIPKIIHYCWFGRNPLPESAIKCINSWKKFFPDYEIKEWNENNFPVGEYRYVKEAYESKKWAFVSDFVRLYAVYNFGGAVIEQCGSGHRWDPFTVTITAIVAVATVVYMVIAFLKIKESEIDRIYE